jgi:hypothetical protein
MLITHCDEGTNYTGTGILDSKSQSLSMAFINPKNAQETGVSFSHINPDGSLYSIWTYLNNPAIAHSSCTKENA